MIMVMVYIIYREVFVGGTIVFDQAGKVSDFAVWQHLCCILYQQIGQ